MRITSLIITCLTYLPSIYSQNTPPPWTDWNQNNMNDHDAIELVLNLEAIAADTKTWALYSQVYHPNASANFSPLGPTYYGIAEITAFASNALTNLTSQHLHGTMLINIDDDCLNANATMFAQATLFENPQLTPGQVAYDIGYYNDNLVKTEDGWRIMHRLYRFFGPGKVGNLTILPS